MTDSFRKGEREGREPGHLFTKSNREAAELEAAVLEAASTGLEATGLAAAGRTAEQTAAGPSVPPVVGRVAGWASGREGGHTAAGAMAPSSSSAQRGRHGGAAPRAASPRRPRRVAPTSPHSTAWQCRGRPLAPALTVTAAPLPREGAVGAAGAHRVHIASQRYYSPVICHQEGDRDTSLHWERPSGSRGGSSAGNVRHASDKHLEPLA